MPRGRPFEPGNKFGRGRPRGSRNHGSLVAQDLLASHSEPVVRQALVLALKGDGPLLRTLLGHILSRRRDLPVKTGPLPTATAEELSQTSEKLMKRVASGQISPGEALELFTLLEHRRHMIETEGIAMRLHILEQRGDRPNENGM